LLVVYELVTNAMQHGAEPIELRVATSLGHIHIEFKDAGNRRPVMRTPSADSQAVGS
jgi:anti-sigma regulatory factor (Ser/Thr protein kinase)